MIRKALVLAALVLLVAAVLVPGSARADAYQGPQLYGKRAADGTFLVFTWPNPLIGLPNFVTDGITLPEDQVYVTIVSFLANTTLNLTVVQFLERDVQVPYTVGNETLTRTVTQRYDVTWANVTVPANPRSVVTTAVPLPTSPDPHVLEVGYRDAMWRVTHRTAPAIWPIGIFTRGGQLAFYLSNGVLFSLDWGVALAVAAGIKRRIHYWPKFDWMSWVLVLGFAGVASFFLLAYAFYDVASIEWWWWTIPFFVVALAVTLNYYPDQVEPWLLVGFHPSARNEELDATFDKILVAADPDLGYIMVHPSSRRKALLRLLGAKTPVTFDPGPAAWYAVNERWGGSPHGIARLYLLDPGTELEAEYEHFAWKPLMWKVKRPGIVAGKCHVPLSYRHSHDAASFIAGYTGVSMVAKQRSILEQDNILLKAQLRAGTIEKNLDEMEIFLTELAVSSGMLSKDEAEAEVEKIRMKPQEIPVRVKVTVDGQS